MSVAKIKHIMLVCSIAAILTAIFVWVFGGPDGLIAFWAGAGTFLAIILAVLGLLK